MRCRSSLSRCSQMGIVVPERGNSGTRLCCQGRGWSPQSNIGERLPRQFRLQWDSRRRRLQFPPAAGRCLCSLSCSTMHSSTPALMATSKHASPVQCHFFWLVQVHAKYQPHGQPILCACLDSCEASATVGAHLEFIAARRPLEAFPRCSRNTSGRFAVVFCEIVDPSWRRIPLLIVAGSVADPKVATGFPHRCIDAKRATFRLGQQVRRAAYSTVVIFIGRAVLRLARVVSLVVVACLGEQVAACVLAPDEAVLHKPLLKSSRQWRGSRGSGGGGTSGRGAVI